jgi:hypothetical protein
LRNHHVTGILVLPVISADDRGSEEIKMYPYQLSKVLADQRIHDMLAAADRHNMSAAANRRRTLTERPSRFKIVTAQMRKTIAQLYGPRPVRARSTATSISDAGPMGCSA